MWNVVWIVFMAFGSLSMAQENIQQKVPMGVPQKALVWQTFVMTDHSSFEWSIEPTINKLNFRRCDWNDRGQVKCLPPILSRGLNPEDFQLLLQYYKDTIANSGGHKINQIIGTITASLVGVGAYLTTAGIVMNIIPKSVSTVLKGSYHVVTVGAILALLSYAWTVESTRYRQSVIFDNLQNRVLRTRDGVPLIYLPDQSVFEEFAKTFRQSLWNFVHPSGYTPGMNLILQ
jgi:hypothetical protein